MTWKSYTFIFTEASNNDILLTVLQSTLYIKFEVDFLLLDLLVEKVAQTWLCKSRIWHDGSCHNTLKDGEPVTSQNRITCMNQNGKDSKFCILNFTVKYLIKK